ncbi:MAG: GMC family oxidoreductase [bacterium]
MIQDFSAADHVGGLIQTHATWGTKPIELKCDVVIVGCGPGGLTTAAKLSEAGLSVVMLEGGDFWKKGSFNRKQSWALKNLYQDAGSRIMQGNVFIPVASGRGVGGGTLVNSGISFRTPDYVLDEWTSRWGLDHWKDRETLFREVEEVIGPAPTRADIAGENSNVAMRGFAKMDGVKHAYMPRNTPGCVGCGTCQTGCPSSGKASADVTWLPRALRRGTRVFTNTLVDKILVSNGRATGVSGRMVDPETQKTLAPMTITAERVVLSAGAINTPMLLQRNGLANSSGQVGKNLHVHPGCGATAAMETEVRIWSGASQGYYAHHPEDREILAETFTAPPEAFFAQIGTPGHDAAAFFQNLKYLAACGFLIRDHSSGTVTAGESGPPTIHYSISAEDQKKFMRGIEFVTEMFFAAGSRRVRPLVSNAKFFTSWNEAKQFIRGTSDVANLLVYASHPMSTCRMGDDPTQCVVRPDGRTYDVENLYIADSSTHPTALGVNPQMTIMANCIAISSHIAR